MAQRIIPILVFFAVLAVGGAVILWRGWRRRMLEDRIYGRGSNSLDRFPAGGGGAAAIPTARWIDTVEQVGRAVANGKPPEAGLREWLAQAGYYEDSATTIYVGAQLCLGLLALAIGGAAAFSFDLSLMIRGCIVVAVLATFCLLPNL